MVRTLLVLTVLALATRVIAQQAATWPANESRTPDDVRSVSSIGSDLKVPLCPEHFHDSLARDGIAATDEPGVTPAHVKVTVPSLMTMQAIGAAGTAHIGNFSVTMDAVVDTKGVPHDVCLRKSSGYGLDASAAAAVAQYRYTPAKKNGKPVASRVAVDVRMRAPIPRPTGQPPGNAEPPETRP